MMFVTIPGDRTFFNMLLTSSPTCNQRLCRICNNIKYDLIYIITLSIYIMYHRYVFIPSYISHYERTNERTNEGNNIIIKHGVVIIRPNFAPVIERGLGNTKVF